MIKRTKILMTAMIFFAMFCFFGQSNCPAPEDDIMDLSVIQVSLPGDAQGMPELKYGQMLPINVFIKNISPKKTFEGDVSINLYSESTEYPEWGCGGLYQMIGWLYDVKLAPREQIVATVEIYLCRPEIYTLRAEIQTFPQDAVAGNNVLEEKIDLQWEEYADLSFYEDIENYMYKYYYGISRSSLFCGMYIYNSGNIPLHLPDYTVDAIIKDPIGETEIINLQKDIWLYPNKYGWTDLSFINDLHYEGEYEVTLKIDPKNTLEEKNELDNELSFWIPVYYPDLTINGFTCEKVKPSDGKGYQANCEVGIKNVGKRSVIFEENIPLLQNTITYPSGYKMSWRWTNGGMIYFDWTEDANTYYVGITVTTQNPEKLILDTYIDPTGFLMEPNLSNNSAFVEIDFSQQ